MTRRVFYSFHYVPDNWRAGQVRNIGTVEGNKLLSDNSWEEVKKKGDSAISNWIDGEMRGKSCAVVLVGANTARRKWIDYEIRHAWDNNKGVVGIYVHNLENILGQQSSQGNNPFYSISLKDGRRLSSVVKCYNPPRTTGSGVYRYISDNIADWVEEAITIRGNP